MDYRQPVPEDDKFATLSSSDGTLAELLSMGFAMSAAVAALSAQGVDNLADAVEFLLAGNSSQCLTGAAPLILHGEHKNNEPMLHESKYLEARKPSTSSLCTLNEPREHCPSFVKHVKHTEVLNVNAGETDQEQLITKTVVCGNASVENFFARAEHILSKYFGLLKLKSFQMEALETWANGQDCLVLAATGSGKSLCFQLPALLTGKVVVVISPLISLMHDQCQQLSRHGISACFLGSGQLDQTVEKKAMAGVYSIVYVCPETLPRLLEPLIELACKRGLALFAIDEAHCISKWGHDFRPHYRRLSTIRKVFKAQSSHGLQDTVPIMALTATATECVQLDIMKSLKMDIDNTTIVRTTLFRPNLRFSVHHSKTSKSSSYEDDFRVLVNYYLGGSGSLNEESDCKSKSTSCSARTCIPKARLEERQHEANCSRALSKAKVNINVKKHKKEEECDEREAEVDGGSSDDGCIRNINEVNQAENTGLLALNSIEQQELTVDFLEDDYEDEMERLGGDFEVGCNDFPVFEDRSILGQSLNTRVEHSPSIVYVPTRKETESIAKFLLRCGLKAAPYHAKLPKAHLQGVHQQFHLGSLQVIVATIAFGMGIDKPDVRHIIHYGWPQNLEAYYQEAGRAGRDGLPSECSINVNRLLGSKPINILIKAGYLIGTFGFHAVLYCDMTVLPSLLPSRRDKEQNEHALYMLEQCFRYGLSTSKCRANTLMNYFGGALPNARCEICDVCTHGPPPLENLTLEAEMLLMRLASQKEISEQPSLCQRKSHVDRSGNGRAYHHAVEEIAKCNKVPWRSHLWWRGFGRVLNDAGFLKEASLVGKAPSKLIVPHLRNPEVTTEGQKFLATRGTDSSVSFLIHPQGDMIQAMLEPCKLSRRENAAEWGRGWADPEIRKQRLGRISARQPCNKRRRRRRDWRRQGRLRLSF